MRYVSIVVTTILLAGCGELFQPPSTAQHLQSAVANINRSGTEQLSEDIPGATMTALAEGEDTLVIRLDNFPSGNVEYDPNAFRKLLRPNICAHEGAKYFLQNGGKIRVEVTSNYGKEWTPVGIIRC